MIFYVQLLTGILTCTVSHKCIILCYILKLIRKFYEGVQIKTRMK